MPQPGGSTSKARTIAPTRSTGRCYGEWNYGRGRPWAYDVRDPRQSGSVLSTEVEITNDVDVTPMEPRAIPMYARLAGSWTILTVLIVLMLIAKAL